MPFAANGDCRLWFDTIGDAGDPALLLVNGLGGQSINYADAWCEMFAATGLFVIRFDNREVGLSSEIDTPYTLSDMAADAIAVLDTTLYTLGPPDLWAYCQSTRLLPSSTPSQSATPSLTALKPD